MSCLPWPPSGHLCLFRSLPGPHRHVGMLALGQNRRIALWAPQVPWWPGHPWSLWVPPFCSWIYISPPDSAGCYFFLCSENHLCEMKTKWGWGWWWLCLELACPVNNFLVIISLIIPPSWNCCVKSSWVPSAYPVHLGVIKIQLSISGWLVQSHQGRKYPGFLTHTHTENHSITETLKPVQGRL